MWPNEGVAVKADPAGAKVAEAQTKVEAAQETKVAAAIKALHHVVGHTRPLETILGNPKYQTRIHRPTLVLVVGLRGRADIHQQALTQVKDTLTKVATQGVVVTRPRVVTRPKVVIRLKVVTRPKVVIHKVTTQGVVVTQDKVVTQHKVVTQGEDHIQEQVRTPTGTLDKPEDMEILTQLEALIQVIQSVEVPALTSLVEVLQEQVQVQVDIQERHNILTGTPKTKL